MSSIDGNREVWDLPQTESGRGCFFGRLVLSGVVNLEYLSLVRLMPHYLLMIQTSAQPYVETGFTTKTHGG